MTNGDNTHDAHSSTGDRAPAENERERRKRIRIEEINSLARALLASNTGEAEVVATNHKPPKPLHDRATAMDPSRNSPVEASVKGVAREGFVLWNNAWERLHKCDIFKLPAKEFCNLLGRIYVVQYTCMLQLEFDLSDKARLREVELFVEAEAWPNALGVYQLPVLRTPLIIQEHELVDIEGTKWEIKNVKSKVVEPPVTEIPATADGKGLSTDGQPTAASGTGVDEVLKVTPQNKDKRTNRVWTDNARKNVAKLWISYRSEIPGARLMDCYDQHKGSSRLHESIKTFKDFKNCVGAAKKAKLIPVMKTKRGKVAGSREKITGKPRQ